MLCFLHCEPAASLFPRPAFDHTATPWRSVSGTVIRIAYTVSSRYGHVFNDGRPVETSHVNNVVQTAPVTVCCNLDILVIADDDQTVAAYVGLLRASGWRVDGWPALPRAWRHQVRPRLILLCGWKAVLAAAHQTPAPICAHDVVIVACCCPNVELTEKALDYGVDIVVNLPCSPPLLVRRLRAALRWTLPR